MNPIPLTTLQRLSLESGLQLAGITDVSPNTVAGKRLVQWQSRGYAGELSYMLRNPALLSDAGYLSKSSKTLLSFTVYYEQKAHPERPQGFGRVARYAWGRDYHKVLKRGMKRLLKALKEQYGSGVRARYFSDSVPLLERAYASRAGSGFVGRNTMLIQPGGGSYFFLAEMLLNLPVSQQESELLRIEGNCGSCRKCIPSCPTGALVGEYELDARLCISNLTIERRGVLDREERQRIGEWLFGCDICQDVCPFNHSSQKRANPPALEEFSASQGVGPLLELEQILNVRTDERYIKLFAGTPLMRAKREGLLRNAAIVAANTSATNLLSTLKETASHDRSPIVRLHSLWAACRMLKLDGKLSEAAGIAEKFLSDQDQGVQQEAKRIIDLDLSRHDSII